MSDSRKMTDSRISDELSEKALIASLEVLRKKEIKYIESRRKHFIGKLEKGILQKDDYLAYINFKLDILKVMEKKATNVKNPQTYISLYRHIIMQINKIYCSSIKNFPTDEELMMSYMAFTKKLKDRGHVINLFSQMFVRENCPPEMYGFATTWYFREIHSIETSRKIYSNGMMRFPRNDTIHLTAFAIELDYLKEKRKENQKAEASSKSVAIKKEEPNCSVEIKPEEQCNHVGEKEELLDEEKLALCDTPNHLKSEFSYALHVFYSGIKTIPDPVLAYQFLEISKDYDFVYEIEAAILKYVLHRFRHDEKAWDLFIRRALRGLRFPQSWNVKISRHSPLRKRIECCWGAFKSALKVVNNELMWSNFIELCIKLNTDRTHLRVFKRRLLMETLQEAHTQEKLAEKYYLLWVAEIMSPVQKRKKRKCKVLQKDGKEKKKRKHQNKKKLRKVEEILHGATTRIPASLELWRARLRFYIRHNNEVKIILTLKDAAAALDTTDNVCDLLELTLQYYQLLNTSKVEILFKRAIEPESGIALFFKPKYLEWVALSHGIDGARDVYEEYANKKPFCLEFHIKMIKFEEMVPSAKVMKKKHIRQCFENMCYQFGEEDPNVWINYIKYEKDKGDNENIEDIRDRATVMLLPIHLDRFQAEIITPGEKQESAEEKTGNQILQQQLEESQHSLQEAEEKIILFESYVQTLYMQIGVLENVVADY